MIVNVKVHEQSDIFENLWMKMLNKLKFKD